MPLQSQTPTSTFSSNILYAYYFRHTIKKYILDILIARTDSHDLREEDEDINISREDTEAKEDTEEEPLSYVTEDVA